MADNNRNTGEMNTGNRNAGSWNTGYCNTKEPLMYCFDKPTSITRSDFEAKNGSMPIYPLLTEWIDQSNMTPDEKKAHPEFGNTGGFLRKNDFKEAFIKALAAAPVASKDWFLKLPNFDADIFLEITGVDVRANVARKESYSGEKVTVIFRGQELTATID